MLANNLYINTSSTLSFLRNKSIYLFILSFIFFTTCIDEFDPLIDDYENLLVIEGTLIKGNTKQYIRISKTSPVGITEFVPVTNCVVKVIDDTGAEYLFQETNSGVYELLMPQQALSYDRRYQLHVFTPDDKAYQSDMIQILESSPVDSVYAITEQDINSPEEFSNGLQFYVDLKAPEIATKNYMWEMEETWELHSVYDIDGEWSQGDTIDPVYMPRTDKKVCYSENTIKNYFTSSTENLVVNEKKKIPLIFIPSSDKRLNIKYSLLVKQYALNSRAYAYYTQNKLSNDGVDELYQTQPKQSKSNIVNVNDENEVVLGIFWGSSFTEKRIFIDGPVGAYNIFHCNDVIEARPAIGQTLVQYFQSRARDLSLIALEFVPDTSNLVRLWGYPSDQTCIDCTANGASTIKPAYWE